MQIAITIGIAVFVFTLLLIKFREVVGRVDDAMSEESGFVTKEVLRRSFSFHIGPEETIELTENDLPERIEPSVLAINKPERNKPGNETSLLELLRNPDKSAADIRDVVREKKKSTVRVIQSKPEPAIDPENYEELISV